MKIMGIDYGDARTGVSISDPTGFLAGSPQVISTWNTEKLLDDLTALVQKEKIEEIVMGLPKNMNATQGERAEKCAAFAAKLGEFTGIQTATWDERLTTVSAHRALNEVNVRGKKRKNIVDAVSAVMILEDFLKSREPLNKSQHTL